MWRTNEAMRFDDDIIYTYVPDSTVQGMKINDIGCIGDDALNTKHEDEIRVLLLGGSTSFSEAYVQAVKKYLKAKISKDVAVISCGKPRYTART